MAENDTRDLADRIGQASAPPDPAAEVEEAIAKRDQVIWSLRSQLDQARRDREADLKMWKEAFAQLRRMIAESVSDEADARSPLVRHRFAETERYFGPPPVVEAQHVRLAVDFDVEPYAVYRDGIHKTIEAMRPDRTLLMELGKAFLASGIARAVPYAEPVTSNRGNRLRFGVILSAHVVAPAKGEPKLFVTKDEIEERYRELMKSWMPQIAHAWRDIDMRLKTRGLTGDEVMGRVSGSAPHTRPRE